MFIQNTKRRKAAKTSYISRACKSMTHSLSSIFSLFVIILHLPYGHSIWPSCSSKTDIAFQPTCGTSKGMIKSRFSSSFLFSLTSNYSFGTGLYLRDFRCVSHVCASSKDLSSHTSEGYISNELLVQSRLSVQMGKRNARNKYIEENRQRNLRLKKLLHTNSTTKPEGGQSTIPDLYALKVSVDKKLRDELNLNGREKRGRVFIEFGSDGCTSLKGLKQEIHSFFRCLKRSSYLMEAALPQVSPDGAIISPPSENMDTAAYLSENFFWPINSDEDVIQTFTRVSSHYNSSDKELFKRPTMLLHIYKDPNAPQPPPPPPYLNNLPDPDETESMTMLSFYSFPEPPINNPEEFGDMLRKQWKPFGALGRVYVAEEGVNAQMAIPTNVMPNFMECCKSIRELGEYMENGINIDPIPLSMEEFRSAGISINENGPPSPPFKALHVRVRSQIVADGLTSALDWRQAGYDMPPEEWHRKINEAKTDEMNEKQKPLILDCRNHYETGVGRFDLAEPLNTESFRDSWKVLEDRLKDVPKDSPIMTYCTGGIRCVKVGAYLTQSLNFTNVSRLAGGIIAYDRNINTDGKNDESLFKGTNYVFDGRVGRTITTDALGECITCGKKTNLLSNCRNTNCHKRMVQCEECKDIWLGTCSNACRQRLMTARKSYLSTQNIKKVESKLDQQPSKKLTNVEDYAEFYSSFNLPLLEEIQKNTEYVFPTGAHMVSGSTQGQFLKTLALLTKNGKILEVGTFTGYATSCFWSGVESREGGGMVLSLERDLRAVDLAAKHLNIMEEYGMNTEGAKMAKRIREPNGIENTKSAISIEDGHAITFRANNSECHLAHVTDALGTMEEMIADFGPYSDFGPFDLIFIDADKTRLLEYVEASLSLLKQGGLIAVDNVLWKGLVLEISNGSNQDEEKDLYNEIDTISNAEELKRSRRARRLAGIMHRFNEAIANDERVEVMMLPVRDGLSLIRKK